MPQHQDDPEDRIRKNYRVRQSRQIIAISLALFLVLLTAVVSKRPDLFGKHSKEMLFAFQTLIIALFIGFTAVNWRCPSCKAYLGSDITRSRCKRCGVRLQ